MSTQSEEYRKEVWGGEATRGHEFERLDEGRYRLRVADAGTTLEVDHLRRRSGELVGELTARCSLPGAATFNGVLSVADLNLSSQRARVERGKHLAIRSQAEAVDWVGLLEELTQRVVTAERTGEPLVILRDVPRPPPDDSFSVDGFPLLKRHPMILFGDGGAAKSLIGLYILGRLEQAGVRAAMFDWELSAEDHRIRLESLFGPDMPKVRYARCAGPLVHEAARLRRFVRDERLEYVVLDSVAFACDGPPESAEVAGRYFRAVRGFGTIGSLHIAHISRSEGSEQKPFGSAFWHNGARATWFIKAPEERAPNAPLPLGLFNRKVNLGARRPPLGFDVDFGPESITFKRSDVGDTPELAKQMSVRQRMAFVLRHGAMTIDELVTDLEAPKKTIQKYVNRYTGQFTLLEGGLVGLKARE